MADGKGQRRSGQGYKENGGKNEKEEKIREDEGGGHEKKRLMMGPRLSFICGWLRTICVGLALGCLVPLWCHDSTISRKIFGDWHESGPFDLF